MACDLPALPEAWQCETAMCPNLYTAAQLQAYATAYATAAVLAERARVRAEVRRNDDGTLDEVVGFGTFHLEQMDAGHWWMQLGPHAVHLQAHRVIKAIIHENEHGDDDAR